MLYEVVRDWDSDIKNGNLLGNIAGHDGTLSLKMAIEFRTLF